MNYFGDHKRLYSVLTSGYVSIEIECGRYGCYVTPSSGHTVAYDAFGNVYVNGLPAHIEVRAEEW